MHIQISCRNVSALRMPRWLLCCYPQDSRYAAASSTRALERMQNQVIDPDLWPPHFR